MPAPAATKLRFDGANRTARGANFAVAG